MATRLPVYVRAGAEALATCGLPAVGVLRLRGRFAARSSHFAQDDKPVQPPKR